MGSSRREIELEEQLKEVGNVLLSPPSAIDELTNLLDKVEQLLANVEQAPSRSMQDALLPSMKALIVDELLRHSDVDVRLSVLSCISEITRITAPEAPYDDEVMKEIFQLSIEAFEKLSHVSGRCYTKAVSILDTVAKVRSCLVMLDLECDTLIIEMFQHFLKFIRSNHPHTVFSAMETIMTLVINESEDISWDLLSILLASVQKANQDVSPISWKLGEKVITNCAVKLKSTLMEAVQSRGIALDEYAEIVSDICKSGYETLQGLSPNPTGKYLATKRLDSVSPGEVCHDVDDISKSMKCNGTAPTGNDNSFINNRSSKVLEQCSHADHSRSTDGRGSADPDNLDHVKPEIEPEGAPKKRGRKPNSLMNPEEGYDHSWIFTGRKTPKVPGHRKSHDKGYDCSLSVAPDSKKTSLLSAPKKVGEPPSPTTKSRFHDESHSRRGRPKKKESMEDQDGGLNSLSVRSDKSAKSFIKKETENRCETEIKRQKRSLESGLAAMTNEQTTPAPGCGVLEKEAEVPSHPKGKPQKLSVTKARGMDINQDRSLVKADIKKGNLVVAASAKSISDASGTKKRKISKTADKSSNEDGNNLEETPKAEVKRKHTAEKELITSKAASKSTKRERNYSEKTPKMEVKMKHTAGKEVASETPGLGEHLVGRRIKVWWPRDKTFYDGVVDSYDHIKKKHRILYADGDEERLNLKKERWELIGDGGLSQGGQETNVIKPAASPDIMQKGKGEAKFELVKEVKASSLKRGNDYAIASKAKTRKSGATSADGAKLGKATPSHDPMTDATEKDSISKGDDQNSINKLIVRDRKLILTRSRPQQTTMSPSKGESPKGSRESPGVYRSGGEYLDNMVEKNGKSSADIEANGSVDIDK